MQIKKIHLVSSIDNMLTVHEADEMHHQTGGHFYFVSWLAFLQAPVGSQTIHGALIGHGAIVQAEPGSININHPEYHAALDEMISML